MVWKKLSKKHSNHYLLEDPKKNHQYVLTVDCSRGVSQDYSATVVVDVTQFPYKVVAKYRNNEISPILFPNVVFDIATYYNEAMVLVEVNDIVKSVGHALHNDLEYENVVMTEHGGRKGQRVSSAFGKTSFYGLRMIFLKLRKLGSLY